MTSLPDDTILTHARLDARGTGRVLIIACGALARVQRCTRGDELWTECFACGMVRYPDEAPDDDGNRDTFVRLKPH